MNILRDTKMMVLLAMFVALNIVLTRFLSIETPIVRVSFTFLPIALSAMFFGAIPAGIAAAVADVVGFVMFSRGSLPFFPGFTMSAFLTGALYGIALYDKPVTIARVVAVVVVITLFIHLGFNTLWVSILTGSPFVALLPTRIPPNIIMAIIQVVAITASWKYLSRFAGESGAV